MGEQRRDVKQQGESAAYWEGYGRAQAEAARRDAGFPYEGVSTGAPGVAEALAGGRGTPPRAAQSGAGSVGLPPFDKIERAVSGASMGDPVDAESIRAGAARSQELGNAALRDESEEAAEHMAWLNKNAWRGPDWIEANDPWKEAARQKQVAEIANRLR